MIVLLCLEAWIHVTVMFRNSWRWQCRGSGRFMVWVLPLHDSCLSNLVWTFMVETCPLDERMSVVFSWWIHQYVQYVVIVLIWLSSDEWCVNVWVLVMKMFIFIYDGLAVSTRVVSQTIFVDLDGFRFTDVPWVKFVLYISDWCHFAMFVASKCVHWKQRFIRPWMTSSHEACSCCRHMSRLFTAKDAAAKKGL